MHDFYNFFSFSAKKAVYRASELCQQFKNQYLDPEHILYSILNLRSCGAVQVLHHLDADIPKFTYSIEAYLFEHRGEYAGNALFSQRTIGLLDLAYREVKRMHHREIGTTHLLIALAQDRSAFMKDLFEQHGLNARRIREQFLSHLKGRAESKASATRPQLERAVETTAGVLIPSNMMKCFDEESRETLHMAVRLATLFELPDLSPLFLLLAIAQEPLCSGNWLLQEAGGIVPKLLEELLHVLNDQRAAHGKGAQDDETPLGHDRQMPPELVDETAAIPLGEMLPGHPGSLSPAAFEQLREKGVMRLSAEAAKVLGSAFATAMLAGERISHRAILLGLLWNGGPEAASVIQSSGCDVAKLQRILEGDDEGTVQQPESNTPMQP